MDLKPLAAGLGVTALVTGLLALGGRLDASLLAVMLVLLGARIAAASICGDPSRLARIAVASPAFLAFAIGAGIRAGAPGLDAIRGANTVVGPAVTTGPTLVVAGLTLGAVAVILALASTPAIVDGMPGRLDRIAFLALAIAVVAGAAGPQLDDATGLLTWTVGTVVVVGAAVLAAPRLIAHRAPAASAALAVIGLITLAWGGRL